MPSDPRAPRFPSYCCKCSPTTVLNPAWMQDGGATFVGETKYNGQLVRLVLEGRAVYAMVTAPCCVWQWCMRVQAYTWYKDGSQRNYYVAAADGKHAVLCGAQALVA